ncbi:MAG: ATP-binding cassette domain-containing protein [Fibrobacter sp.]|nr:ATP-binding cassette domain-containing protein [Fibrobacter sp.]
MITINVTKSVLTSSGATSLSINLSINENDFFALFGPSGSGKTTTLRMLAGLTRPDSGEIIVNGQYWFSSEKGINIPTQKRNIGFVFQDYALFPTMTVRKNLEYAAGKNKDRIDNLISIMGLKSFENIRPSALSGGQRQRVALARSIIRSPQILLLDEPLSALDTQMRSALQNEIFRIHSDFNLTSIVVSHDVSEIYKLANRVAIYGNGGILTEGSPENVFNKGLSARFTVPGTIVNIRTNSVAAIVTVLAGGNQTEVVMDIADISQYRIGQQVTVAAKAFTPVILPAY